MLVTVSFTYMRNEADCVWRTFPRASAVAGRRAYGRMSPRHQLKEHQLLPGQAVERPTSQGPGAIDHQGFLWI
jgi:hypothetical protein